MSKAGLTIGLLVVTSAFLVALVTISENVTATTRFVGGGGPGNYTTIQEAIDDADPSDTVYVYSGTYYGNLEVYKTLSLVGEDRDTTTVDGGGSGNVVLVTADWVNMTGFTITNSNPGGSAGIRLNSAERCHIAKNNVSSNGYGINLLDSANNTMADNSVTHNQYSGIRMLRSNGAIITGNDFSHNQMGIECFACDHANLIGNGVSSNSWLGIYIQSSTEIEIVGNNVSDNDWGIVLESSAEATIRNNSFTNDGIALAGSMLAHYDSHNITTDNLVHNLPIHYYKNSSDVRVDAVPLGQLLIANCTNVTASNVSIAGTDAGIQMAFVDDAAIIGGNVSSNEKAGVYIYYSTNITVKGSDFLYNEVGVRLIESNVAVMDNSITDNKYGIHINSNDDILVAGSNISSNVGGVRVDNSSALIIKGNNISSNVNFGIRLLGSSDILVHHNNIFGNTVQAVDGGGNENSWDNGYPSGGNYWSDYAGADNCSGPNQDNCPDPDGIGDTSYLIDADSQDMYPLMLPVGMIGPQPPEVQQAILSGLYLENITLIWSLSPDDGMGFKSVTGYEISRSTTHDSGGTAYGLIASLPNGTSTFVDTYAGEGDPSNYFYRVCAVDVDGNVTCAKNQAGKFTRPLAKGLNLISIPLAQSSGSIEEVLRTVRYDIAWSYDSVTQQWRSHMKHKTYAGGLLEVGHTTGLWVDVTEDSNLTVAGILPSLSMMHLREGWNLVSFPSFNSTYSAGDLKAEIGAIRVEGYDPAPPYYLRVLGDAEVLQTGEAYWVKVHADVDWVVAV